MRVKELKLQNFRGIKDLHLVFNTKYNVIVLAGVNGVGKSSILDCINLLIQYYILICISESSSISDEMTSLFGNKELPNYRDILIESDIQNSESSTKNRVIFQSESGIVEWEIAKYRDNNSKSWNKVHKVARENIASAIRLNLLDGYFYYLSNRRIIDGKDLDVDKYSGTSLMGENNVNFKYFYAWFKDAEDLENEQRLSSNDKYRHPQLEAVRQAVYLLLGKDYTNLKFKRAINKMTIKKSNREIAVDLLSDGEKSLLAMVSHLSRKLAQFHEKLDNPLNSSALVLIDEVELHLHPAWQRMIIPRLTQIFPNCQFIVTTHSPQVLSHVDPECIHILDYDGDNVVVKRPDSSYGLDSNRILEDILGVSKRPQEIQERMLELFRTINNNDLEGAKEIAKELGDRIGIDEPELVKAEATIKRREIIGR